MKRAGSACYNGRMTTVLIIEDEVELVKVLKLDLEKAGYTVLLLSGVTRDWLFGSKVNRTY
jgi:DNA-binding NtrC family response regulator